MRKTSILLLLLSCVAFFSCDDYNDSALKGEIEKLKTDVAALQSQVSAVETIVDALNKKKEITSVTELADGKGSLITFNDATFIEVLNGNTAPIVGVKAVDGVYYWTITTDEVTNFLTDEEGEKLQVSGKDSSSPSMAIDAEGYWTLNGVRIKDGNDNLVKAQGDSFFKEIEENEDAVTFRFIDGTSIVIPKSDGVFIRFEKTSQIFTAGKAVKLNFKFAGLESLEIIAKPDGWRTNVHLAEKYVNVVASGDTFGMGEIKLQGIDKNGLVYLAIIKVGLAGNGFSHADGIFILNEGNMTTENGSLIYINPDEKLYENVYASANASSLGNVTQDLFVHNKKMYIISQNGKTNPLGSVFLNDGMLVVANSETLVKEAAYTDELTSLSWPSHVAVLDDANIFIRDNNGVHRFNATTGELQLIPGTKGAVKNRMAVANGKVFFYASKNLMVLEKNANEVSFTVNMNATISGIEKSKDGNVWVATTGSPSKISKVDSKTYEIIKTNSMTVGSVASGQFATPGITAKGDTLYYGGSTLNVYRHIFSTGECKEVLKKADFQALVPDAKMVYNSMAVHPRTGKVYINTIKGYGWDFLINDISVFDFDNESAVLSQNYKDHTHFPAGFFFNANFE